MCNQVTFTNRLPLYSCKLLRVKIKIHKILPLFIHPYTNHVSGTVVTNYQKNMECQTISVGPGNPITHTWCSMTCHVMTSNINHARTKRKKNIINLPTIMMLLREVSLGILTHGCHLFITILLRHGVSFPQIPALMNLWSLVNKPVWCEIKCPNG